MESPKKRLQSAKCYTGVQSNGKGTKTPQRQIKIQITIMESLAKLLHTLFFGEDEATATKASKIRDIILYMIIGAGLLFAALWFIADEEELPADNIEQTA